MSTAISPPAAVTAAAYRRVAHVAWRRLGRETVVLDLKSKRIYALNAAGGELWHAIGPEGAAIEAGPVADFFAFLHTLGLVETAGADVGPPIAAAGVLAGHSEAPRVIWQDDVKSFGISCLQTPIQGGCQARPTT